MDIRLALMAGTDIPIPECQLTLHQPTIKDIAFVGEADFFTGVQTLCLNKSMFVMGEGKDVLSDVSNFQIFMTIVTDVNTADKKAAVKKVLQITFPQYNVMFSPQSLIFSNKKTNETFPIDENSFDFLQDAMKLVFCSKDGPMDQQAFNPANAKAKEIAEKLMRGRQRVAAQNGTANASVFGQYLSVLSVGLHLPISTLAEYTMFQLYDTMERYALYTNWDIDIRARLAGAKPESQPDNWMKPIHQI